MVEEVDNRPPFNTVGPDTFRFEKFDVPNVAFVANRFVDEAVVAKNDVEVALVNVAEVEKLAKESLDFLAALAMPTIFKYLFPPVFLAVWQWLLTYKNMWGELTGRLRSKFETV